MHERVMRMWTEALRSGKYTQMHRYLADSARKKHCCLGVLCELAIEDGVGLDVDERLADDMPPEFDGCTTELPVAVQEWAGISTDNGDFQRAGRVTVDENAVLGTAKFNASAYVSLLGMNDTGRTFDEIADVIDLVWEKL